MLLNSIGTLIINFDGSAINRSWKLNDSRSKKGQTSEFLKHKFSKFTLSMIIGIFSDGNWLMGIWKDTISSKIFVRFMVNLDRLICDNHKLEYNEVLTW